MSWKGRLRRAINRVLEPAGFTLQRFRPEMRFRAIESSMVRHRQIVEFQEVMRRALELCPELVEGIPEENEIAEFMSILPACPVSQEGGGGSFSAAMLLWVVAKALKPDVVVESGVFRGFTTWLLRQACPRAHQYAFDITFAERQRVEQEVEYHETDWMSVPVKMTDGVSTLIYFDDHVDQWRRIREAAERGFRYIIFDDSLPSTALHNDGWAAVPTVDMLFEPGLVDGELLEWRTECGQFRHHFDLRAAEQTRDLVAHYLRLPDLRFVFGYAPANLVLVVLR